MVMVSPSQAAAATGKSSRLNSGPIHGPRQNGKAVRRPRAGLCQRLVDHQPSQPLMRSTQLGLLGDVHGRDGMLTDGFLFTGSAIRLVKRAR